MGEGIGIDVGMEMLTVVSTDGWMEEVANAHEGLAALVAKLRGLTDVRVLVEPTGGYERLVLHALHAGGIPVRLIETTRAKAFRLSLGRRAKNDLSDGQALARMAVSDNIDDVPFWEPLSASELELRELFLRRDQLVRMAQAEESRLEKCQTARVRASHEALARRLRDEVAELEALMRATMAADLELERKSKVLQAERGVGLILAAALLSMVPELGTLNRRKIASLLGVAPYDNRSSTLDKRKHVRGGRSIVRTTLYQASVSAARWNPVLREYRDRLLRAGKPAKVARVAVMRKLLIHLNSVMRAHVESLANGSAPSG